MIIILDRDLIGTSEAEIYNVLTCNAILSDIVNTIKSVVPELIVEKVDTPILNQNTYFVLNDKLRSIGFYPRYNLHEELAKTIRMLGG